MKKIGTTTEGLAIIEFKGIDLVQLSGAYNVLRQLFETITPESMSDPIPYKVPQHYDEVKTAKIIEIKNTVRKPVVKSEKPKVKVSGDAIQTARTYCVVHEILKKHGVLTKDEIVKHMADQGVESTTQRLSVILSTYKTLFGKKPGHKWGAIISKPVIRPAFNPHAGKKEIVPAVNPEAAKKSRLEMLRKMVKKDSYVPPSIKEEGMPAPRLDDIPEFARARQEASRE